MDFETLKISSEDGVLFAEIAAPPMNLIGPAGREAFFKLVAESNNPDMAEQAHQLVEWAAEIFRGERKYDPTLRGVISSPRERKQ